jgi:hypothetical protein
MYQSPPPDRPVPSPQGRRWMLATLGAGTLAGLLGFARYTLVCRAICGPTHRGVFTFTPGYVDSIIAGCFLAGPFCVLLVLLAQYLLIRDQVQSPLWFLLGLPAAGATTIATILIIAANAEPTDVVTGTEFIIPLVGLVFSFGAGVLIAIATSRALKVPPMALQLWRRASIGAWLQGWGVLAFLAYLGSPALLIVGWLACWAIVGLRTGREVSLLLGMPPAGEREV